MTCSDNTCGTGGWTGPKPGDPNNNSVISATPAFGGIDVTWTYPTTYPEAVAHVILYRGLTNHFEGAIRHQIVSGGFFYDKIDTATEYYYWIVIVSVNGTYGEPIGPASAVARPTIAAMMEQLTDKIELGSLSQALKDEIARISTVDNALINEIQNRSAYNTLLGTALTNIQANLDEAMAFVGEQIALRADADGVLAQQINTVQSSLGDDLASVQVDLQTNIDTVAGEVTNIGALYTAKVSVNGLVGGFGIYNDGSEVEAGFDVDTFWVGRTQANKRKPFIIVGGETFIDQAVINQLTFDKLRSADGSVIVSGGKIQANYLQVNEIMGGAFTGWAWPAAGSNGFYLGPNGLLLGNYNDGKYVQISRNGDISAPGFSITNGTATYSGALAAASGTFSGAFTASAVNAVNTINIAGQAVTIPVSAYTAGSVTGIYGDVSLQTVSITSSGAPITVSACMGIAIGYDTSGAKHPSVMRIYRSGTLIYEERMSDGVTAVVIVDTPGAGTFTYEAKLSQNLGGYGTTVAATVVKNRSLVLLETKR